MNDAGLNLLSPQKKTKLKKLVHFVAAKELLELVILTCALLGISHILGWMVLTSFVTDLAQSTIAVSGDSSRYNSEIIQLNQTVRQLRAASDQYAPLAPLLFDLITETPPDIRLTDIQIDRAQSSLTLSGVAQTREGLLAYQKALGEILWLGQASIPRSQLFQKENIGFQVTAAITALPALIQAEPTSR